LKEGAGAGPCTNWIIASLIFSRRIVVTAENDNGVRASGRDCAFGAQPADCQPAGEPDEAA